MTDDLDFKTTMWLAELDLTLSFKLHKAQQKCLAHIMEDKGFLAVLPTGMGKTILGVMAAKHEVKVNEKKCLILAPLRALTAEHVDTFESYELRSMLDNGEHPKDIEDYEKGDYDVVHSTFEKMDSIIRNFDKRIENNGENQKRDIVFSRFGCIVIDEIHGIEDISRGVNLESFIMTVKYLYPNIKIIGLSATIGNYEDFAKWLGVPVVYEPPESRPVPLERKYYEVYSKGSKQQYAEKLQYLKQDIYAHKGKRMVAVTAVNRTKQIIYDLCGITDYTKPDLSYFMKKHKMAWHYSGARGMTEDERMAVEWAFDYDSLEDNEQYYYEGVKEYICRKEWLKANFGLEHGINLIVCTPTLIVGRNLPVTYVDIFDHIQYTFLSGAEIIGANRLQQTIGRAGRLKFAKLPDGTIDPSYKGVATIYATVDDMPEVQRRAENPFAIISYMESHLGEKMLAWINSRVASNNVKLIEFIKTSFDPIIAQNAPLIEKELEFLKKHKFIEEVNGKLYVTLKGLKTVRYYIQPETVVAWGYVIQKYLSPKYKGDNFPLREFIIESMNVEEHYKSICVSDREIQYISRVISSIGGIDENVAISSVKSFMFVFPEYSLQLANIKPEEYIIPEHEATSLRKQFERFSTAFADIYSHTSLHQTLETCNSMIKAGIFNIAIGELMSIDGIGSTYAERLLIKGVDSRKKLLDTYAASKNKLITIMNISATKLDKIIEGMKNESKQQQPND